MTIERPSINFFQYKYVIIAEDTFILTHKGFARIEHINSSEVHLFPHKTAAEEYLLNSPYAECEGITYAKVRVLIEEVPEDV
jgi:hypothetical protein